MHFIYDIAVLFAKYNFHLDRILFVLELKAIPDPDLKLCDALSTYLYSFSVFLKFIFLQGFRTLEDIRTKAHLSAAQKIGLKHYNEFLDRMPRDEAAAIERVVLYLHFTYYLYVSFCDVHFFFFFVPY